MRFYTKSEAVEDYDDELDSGDYNDYQAWYHYYVVLYDDNTVLSLEIADYYDDVQTYKATAEDLRIFHSQLKGWEDETDDPSWALDQIYKNAKVIIKEILS